MNETRQHHAYQRGVRMASPTAEADFTLGVLLI